MGTLAQGGPPLATGDSDDDSKDDLMVNEAIHPFDAIMSKLVVPKTGMEGEIEAIFTWGAPGA